MTCSCPRDWTLGATWEPHRSLDLELLLGDAEVVSCPQIPRGLESEGVSECVRVVATITFVRTVQLLLGDFGKDQKSGLWAEGTLCSHGKDEKLKRPVKLFKSLPSLQLKCEKRYSLWFM